MFDMGKANKVGFDTQENNKVGFDMTKCKVGDKMLTRAREVVTVIQVVDVDSCDYPYLVRGVDKNRSVAVDGRYLAGQIGPYDIIGFADAVNKPEKQMLLSTDPEERKQTPITTGVLDYFPLAIAEVAKLSMVGNEQHNPGQPLHWDKSKSTDHADCIARHLIDRGTFDTDGQRHSAKLAWRVLALLQIELENAQKEGEQ